MQKILIVKNTILLVFIFSISLAAKADSPYIKLMLKHDSHFAINYAMIFGLEFEKKSGKLAKKGEYFKKGLEPDRFKFKLQGAVMDFYEDAVIVDRNYLRENGYFIANYKHPRTKILTRDTVRLPKIIRIENNNTQVNYATSQKLSLTFYFEGDSKLSIEGNDVGELLYRYNMQAQIPEELGAVNGSTGFVTLNSYKEEVQNSLNLILSNDMSTFNVEIPFNYDRGYNYNFTIESCLLYFLKHKEHILSNQINVVVGAVNDTLYRVKMSKGAMNYTTVINASKAILTINGAGVSGLDGENGRGKSSVFINSNGTVNTVAGNPGSSGTHGRNGDHITVFMPKSFTEHVSSISFITSGGYGGEGGKGGSGASIYHEDITLLEILFAPTGPSGANGAYGNNGNAGIINYIYSD